MRPIDPLPTTPDRTRDLRRVRAGETVVAFGADVVLETEPLEGGIVLAVIDVGSSLGAMAVPVGPDADRVRREVDRFWSHVPRSLVRAGADRRRLRFVAAGGSQWLPCATKEGASGAQPRVLEVGGVVVARLDLGSGGFHVELV